MRRRHLVPVLVAALGLLAACSGDDAEKTTTAGTGYVALGDSYVSGPGIDVQDPEVPWCVRSDHNYPSLIAATMPDVDFVDVSCGGEDTSMMMDGRTLGDGTVVDPQVGAVGADTSLVTIGIGGNDGSASAGLFNYCLLPATANDADCTTFGTQYMPTVFPKTRERVDAVIADVKERAPKARIILVGYLSIVPAAGQCPQLPVSSANRASVSDYEDTMNATLEDAARRAEVDYVDTRTMSREHDVCSDDPWVNGVENSPSGDGAFLHPTAAGMRAVADEVLKVIND